MFKGCLNSYLSLKSHPMKKLLILIIAFLPVVAMAQQTQQVPQISGSPSDEGVPVPPANDASKVEQEPIFTFTEVMPEFPGGESAMIAFLQKHVKYPADAKQQKKHGTVYLSFVVNEDGRITDVKVLRSVFPSLDKEAVRIVSVMPNWKPGMQNGKAVKCQFNFPVIFEIR